MVYSYSASYDAAGNVSQYQDSVNGTWGFSYDTLNRLGTAIPGAGVASTYAGQNLCYAYDPYGNRTAESLQSAACPAQESSVTPTAAYNANNWVTWTTVNSAVNGFAYDGAGDVTNDNINTYLYDPEGRVCAVKSTPYGGISSMTGYLYDAEGNRIAKGTITTWGSCDPSANGFQLTETYVLGQGGEELATMSTQNGATSWQRANVYGADRLLATYDLVPDSTGTEIVDALHFHLTDPLGTRRVQTDPNGVQEETCQSLAFGDQLNCLPANNAPQTADDSNPLHFTGKERDAESGNDYFDARYYSSSMGRFLSPDWSAKFDPVPYAKLDDPQSLNLYSYVWNNPLSRTDPDGHQCDTCQKVWNWLTSSHSASASASATAAQGSASNGGLSATAKAGTAQASASASYGTNTSVSGKASASVTTTTINEGGHSTTEADTLTANAGANAGVGLGGKSGVGISAGASANADVLSASQTETITLGPITITGTATGNVGLGANASFSLGTGGVSASAGVTPGYGGALSLGISWGGDTVSGGASVKGTINQTTTTINKPEVTPNE